MEQLPIGLDFETRYIQDYFCCYSTISLRSIIVGNITNFEINFN